jgi:hypothetical protein
VLGAEPLEGFEAPKARHGDVEDYHVGPVELDLLEDLAAVSRLATDLDIFFGFEEPTKALSYDSMIVGYEY